MIRLSALAFILGGLMTAPALAQDCSHLSVLGSGHQGTVMTFSLTRGAIRAPAIMVFGMQQGQTKFDFGMMGSLQLGLGGPLFFAQMGSTDAFGAIDMHLRVPHPMMQRFGMFGQGFTMMFHPGRHHHHHHRHAGFAFCTSNVSGFHVGGRHQG